MKDYQQKRPKEFLLPETVYRQALWAAKDLNRLKSRQMDLIENTENLGSTDYSAEISKQKNHSDITGKKAGELANLAMRIESIEGALQSIPLKYRRGIAEKLFEGKTISDEFHLNTWKKWQQVYIYHVAMNLGLY